jgi:hypothetical protein
MGFGLAGEYGSHLTRALVEQGLHMIYPIDFIEYGGTIEKGLDPTITAWTEAGLAAVYHILDFNVSEATVVDATWVEKTRQMASRLRSPWLTGDIGYWHYGRMLHENTGLVHPLLTKNCLDVTVDNVVAISELVGIPYYPENTPYYYATGDIDLLDFYAELIDRSGSRMVFDCTHFFQYQHARNRRPLDGLDSFPVDRVAEIHLAGSLVLSGNGVSIVEDTHHAVFRYETLEIANAICTRGAVEAVSLEIESAASHDIEGAFLDLAKAFGDHEYGERLRNLGF